MAEAKALAAMLEHQVVDVHVGNSAQPTPKQQTASPAPADRDWRQYLVTCPCGKSFPKHGLGGLGKHATSCDKAKGIQIKGQQGTVYRPYLEALQAWATSSPMTVKDMMNRFRAVQVTISYSGVRTHLDHLVDMGKFQSTRVGRGRQYIRSKEATTNAI